MNKIDLRKYVTTIFVATSFVGLQAQTDKAVVDTVTTDTAAVVLPWPQNVQARLDAPAGPTAGTYATWIDGVRPHGRLHHLCL